MDDGKLISIKGGSVSNPIIATISCMNQVRTLGTPKDICMVLLMSSEQKMAIGAGIPMEYIKTTMEEAEKLIDPNIDYNSSQIASEASVVTKQYESELNKLNNEIKNRDEKIKELTDTINELNSEISTLTTDDTDSKLKDIKLKDQANELNELKAQLSSKNSEIDGLNSTLKEITTERDNYKTQSESLIEKAKLVDAASYQLTEIEANFQKSEAEKLELKGALDELITKNENMKQTMKHVCEKFNIVYDANTNDWVQSVL